MTAVWQTLSLLVVAGTLAHGATGGKVLRMVTWNVADNSGMGGSFQPAALDKLLGIEANNAGGQVADIYAVGLQEQCWQCDSDDMLDIPTAFLRRLEGHGDFEIVGIEATRESNWCELGCKMGTHGTTALFVIAKRGLVNQHRGFQRNDGCSDRFPENDEKGVAYMRLTLSTGQSVCLGTSHLESRAPDVRRQCLKNFFWDAETNLNWSDDCDYHFLSGDFNARTAGVATPHQKDFLPPGTNLQYLKETDELLGTHPYGQSDEWTGNMLTFINSVQKNIFKETSVNFNPTYKLDSAKGSCGGKSPCYRTNRPLSWTDRILHTRGTSLKYDSIHLLKSDHLPVFEEFQLS